MTGSVVLAYHGCDISVRDGLVRGLIKPRLSSNSYDWLGKGMYFFEGDPDRALKLAKFANEKPEYALTQRPIVAPAVVGAILQTDRWLDLTTQKGITSFAIVAQALTAAVGDDPSRLPQNGPAFLGDEDKLNRQFDCAVFKLMTTERAMAHKAALEAKDVNAIMETAPYQATRAPFEQGKPIASSAIFTDSHVQISVHDTSCIVGWFLLPGDSVLPDEELKAASEALVAAAATRVARKPRKRG